VSKVLTVNDTANITITIGKNSALFFKRTFLTFAIFSCEVCPASFFEREKKGLT